MNIIPYQNRIIIPIREQDDKFMHIQELIDAKKKFLINKQKKLKFITKQNKFLDAVKSDYQKYYGYIIYTLIFSSI